MDQTYSFKNKKLQALTNTYKKRGHPFAQQCFVKICTKFQGKWASCSGTRAGNMTTYDFYLFCFYFIINILLTLFL